MTSASGYLFMLFSISIISTTSTHFMLEVHMLTDIYTMWKKVMFSEEAHYSRPVVFGGGQEGGGGLGGGWGGGRYALRCEKRQHLDASLRLARPSARQYQGLATQWLLSQGEHTGKGRVEMSSQCGRGACYVTRLIDETNWWYNIMMAVFHASSSPLACERREQRRADGWFAHLQNTLFT